MNRIDVEVFPSDGVGESIRFTDVNYISLINDETYGIPALISEERIRDEGMPLKVLYISPANVSAVQATRHE